ncbi:MAG: rhomboid family intramembrane serine protease [Bacteroidota bacterium]
MRNRNIFDDLKKFFFSRNMLSRLILINVIVFILAYISYLYYYLLKITPDISICGSSISKFIYWLAVPADTGALLIKPWTVFTYMFLHENFLHILFNMIMLYFSGTLFIQYLGGKKLLCTYIIGGLAGALFYIIAFNFFPVFSEIKNCSIALGASASVIAVLVAIAFHIPDFIVNLFMVFRVKLKYIALALIIIDLFSIPKENPGGHLAHLGGAFWGFNYIMSLKKNNDLYSIFNPIRKFFKNLFRPKPKLRVEYKKAKPVTDDEYNRLRAEKQKKMDAILDKISKNGYDSLSREEKEFLFSSGNKK